MSEQALGVTVIVQDPHTKKVLLGKRKNSYKAGYYGLPGGRIEVGEKMESAARRELEEETGLKVFELKYQGFVKEFQETRDFVHFVFVAIKWQGVPQVMEPEKCEDWEWFDLNDLPEPVVPGHLAGLQLLQSATVTYLEIE